jgi:exosortase A
VPDSSSGSSTVPASVKVSLWAAGLFSLALLLVFHETTWSMVSIWLRSDTFTHGFLILPISIWLVWMEWGRLQFIRSRPVLWVALLIIPPGFVWLLAWLVDVLVIQQLSLVAIMLVGVWAILGHRLTRAMWFPLLFLFFAVPMGEALVAPMMEFTATTTVWLIQKTGIPVYREGLYFMLPSGNWSVVEACSGVRYIIASITLGVLYAYLTYRSLWRRALFVLISAIVPVFANTVRAYIIVMLGHMSGMKLATGVDHLIYGWVFFGLVVFVLFWLGSFWREDGEPAAGESVSQSTPHGTTSLPLSSVRLAALVSLLSAIIWPLFAVVMDSRSVGHIDSEMSLPVAESPWCEPLSVNWQWQPSTSVAGQAVGYYALESDIVGVFIQYPSGNSPGQEVVGSIGRLVEEDSGWRVVGHEAVAVGFGSTTVVVDQARVKGVGEQFLTFSWYRVGGKYTSNDYNAKFKEALASLGVLPPGSLRIVLVVPTSEAVEPAQALLRDFMDQHAAALEDMLDQATGTR